MSVKEKLVELACLRWQLQEGRPLPHTAPAGGSESARGRARASAEAAAPSAPAADRGEDLLC
jgi:hypothetical protein